MSTQYTIHAAIQSASCDTGDAEIILAHILQKDRAFILTHSEDILTHKDHTLFKEYITRRTSGEPLAYITHTKEFYGRNFSVTPQTLIPRPETELLVEHALKNIKRHIDTKQKKPLIIADVGTGSGAIITTLATELKKHHTDHTCGFIATDISKDALEIAHKNATTHAIDEHIAFIHTDLLTPFLTSTPLKRMLAMGAHLLICANLPYVDSAQKNHLLQQPESCGLAFEPPEALWAEDGGLALYKKLLTQLQEIHQSAPDATIIILCEIDPAQETPLTTIIHKKFPTAQIKTHPDLSGRPRVIEFSITA